MSISIPQNQSEVNQVSFLSASHISKRYLRHSQVIEALDDVSLSLKQGEILSLVGFSGCGKSTLLRILAGLIPPSEGKISIDGKTGVEYRKAGKIGFVFQKTVLFDWRTVLGNMLLPAEIYSFNKRLAEKRALNLLEIVGLSGFEKSYPNQLSGGMRQRVALARALMSEPNLLLLDEPFSALDEITRENLWVDFYKIWRQQKLTVVLVSHSIREAVFFGDRVIALSHRPGRVKGDTKITLPFQRDQSLTVTENFIQLCEVVRRMLLS